MPRLTNLAAATILAQSSARIKALNMDLAQAKRERDEAISAFLANRFPIGQVRHVGKFRVKISKVSMPEKVVPAFEFYHATAVSQP